VPAAGEAARVRAAVAHINQSLQFIVRTKIATSAIIVECIGWRLGDAALALAEYSVRQGTEMRMAAARAGRVVVAGQEVTPPATAELLAAFAAEAGAGLQADAVLVVTRRVEFLFYILGLAEKDQDEHCGAAADLVPHRHDAQDAVVAGAQSIRFERPCGCGQRRWLREPLPGIARSAPRFAAFMLPLKPAARAYASPRNSADRPARTSASAHRRTTPRRLARPPSPARRAPCPAA
jgi:hypothetical protein